MYINAIIRLFKKKLLKLQHHKSGQFNGPQAYEKNFDIKEKFVFIIFLIAYKY